MTEQNDDFQRQKENEALSNINAYERYLSIDEENEPNETPEKEKVEKKEKNKKQKSEKIKTKNPFKRFYHNRWQTWGKGKKTGFTIGMAVLALVIVGIIFAFSYINLVDWNGQDKDPHGYVEDNENDINAEVMSSISNADGLRDYLKKWHTNGGELMQSRHVINVLLLGLDDGSLHSDAILLLSLNKRTDEIKLTSIYRDCLTYSNAPTLVTTAPEFMKTTEGQAYGGSEAIVDIVEKNLKIKIDGFVSVNFETFPQVIDALGGVKVPITEKEAAFMASPWKTPVDSGESVLINGKQALVYSRIRYLDSDEERTRRQRNVISSLLEASKSATLTQINDVLRALLPSVVTSFSRTDFLNYGTQAITQGWMNYPMTQGTMPTADTGTTAMLSGKSYWVADYPACAHNLQMLIYGQSNITLEEGRQTVFDFLYENTNISGNNNYYQPQTTLPETQPAETAPAMTTNPTTSPYKPEPTTEPTIESTTGPTETKAPEENEE